ncbi:hypothetical protein ACH47C_26940 [Streptomyces rishiriensis]|uniref:hypothetical protein n=1 Tax=Streptomyces rishiriensis TaxID=68264 RepID=UPI0033EC7723
MTPKTPIEVTAQPLATAGQPQLLVISCPHCGATHRHLTAGERHAPCGAKYTVVAPREEQP